MVKKKNWRSVWGEKEIIQRIRPEYTDANLNNPHKGTTTFQRFNGDPLYKDLSWSDKEGPMWFKPAKGKKLKVSHYPESRISYCRWSWADLEPIDGKIKLDVIAGALKAASDRNQTLQIRSQPYVGDNGPRWLWEKGISKDLKAATYKGENRWDHNDPLYIKYWCRHIKMLGKNFDGHPALESVDIAIGGPCGETGGNANAETMAVIIEAYANAFKKTPLLSLLNGHNSKPFTDHPKRMIGWRQDCYGDLRGDIKKLGGVPEHLCFRHMYDFYPQNIELCGIKDLWKTAPVTLETCWTPAFWFQQGWDIDWIIEHGYKYHLSVFMPKSVYIPEEWMSKIEAFNRKMGYRFHILQMILPLEAKPGQMIQAKTVIDNKGVAPIYRPYHFALKFTQGKNEYIVKFKNDIRKWLPDYTFFDETIKMPLQLKKGEVKISTAIINDQNEAVVKFAIKAIDKTNWHPLTSMDVL